ncbi:MAG: YraN family protein [Bacteroidia bacterium]|nr:YraN family protein [Bacteroidia bacterium]
MADHNELGKKGEQLACEFLMTKGYHILDQNYRYEKGEIDLVVLRMEPAELVFVEVKTRSSEKWGFPEESVTEAKKKMIFKTADAYLYEKNMWTVPVRFDIIAINMKDPENPMFHHIEDAFQMIG